MAQNYGLVMFKTQPFRTDDQKLLILNLTSKIGRLGAINHFLLQHNFKKALKIRDLIYYLLDY